MNERTVTNGFFFINFQQRVLSWMLYVFGVDVARDIQERCHRFLELARNWTNADKIREKWKNKPEFSPLPAEPTITDEQLAISGLNKDWNAAMKRALKAEAEIALMKPVIDAGDDLYASLAECDDKELSKFQRVSRDTYAAVSNAYRAPLIAINEEAHGNV